MIVSEKKKTLRRCGDGIHPFPFAPKVESVTVNYVLSHCFVILTWFGVFRSVAEWSQWFQSFFSGYIQTISHWTNSYTLPCCLRLIPQFYFSVFHCYFDLFSLEPYFAPCFLLSPISSLAYFLPLIYIVNSWTFLRLMSELAYFQILTLASWNEI